MATAYHMVHYRLFTPAGTKLEALCRNALNKQDSANLSLWKRVQDRIFDLPGDPAKKIVLNRVADLTSAVFGEMCLIQNDGLQALLELTATNVVTSNITTAEIFNLQERSAPTNSQFVRGMAYWLSIGNHLFFVKTQSMNAEHIRQYLEWLLKVRTTALPAATAMTLQAEFDRAVTGDIGDIQSLKVSGAVVPFSVQAAAKAPKSDKTFTQTAKATARRILDRSAMFEQAVPIVEALIGAEKTKSLVDSLGNNEYLTVDASVKVRGRRTVESKGQMQELANEIADLTEGTVSIEGKDGKVSDEDAILRTKMPFDLAQEGSNFLDYHNVADQMMEVYKRFVNDGKISA